MHDPAANIETVYAIVTRLEKRVFGNGQPGILQELQEADEANRVDVEAKHKDNQQDILDIKESINKYKWIGVGIILASGFVSGSGKVSLESVLKLLGH